MLLSLQKAEEERVSRTKKKLHSLLSPYLISDILNLILEEYLEYFPYSFSEILDPPNSGLEVEQVQEYYRKESTGIKINFYYTHTSPEKIKKYSLSENGKCISLHSDDKEHAHMSYFYFPVGFKLSDKETYNTIKELMSEKAADFAMKPFWEHENEKYRQPLF